RKEDGIFIEALRNSYRNALIRHGQYAGSSQLIHANCNGYETDISDPGQISREYVGHYGLVSDLQCTGSENDVSLCTSNVGDYCNSGYAAAVDCNTVRLVGGTDYTNGRVEVYDTFNQTWENVCYDHFSYNDAKVICRQLEFYTGAFRMNCHGYEDDLSQCAIDWNNGHCSYDAEVDCRAAQVRLVDGDHYHSGRVEVYYQSQWGTVCRQNFDHNDLMVVCRTLGYYRGYGRGKIYEGVPATGGNVVIEDLQCFGGESNVKHCKSKVWLSNTCDHSQDVNGDIRLVDGGYGSVSGRLEVFYSGQWGTVCSRGFDIRDAQTVCYILGYYGLRVLSTHRSTTYYRSYYIEGRGYGAIMIEDLQCRGREWSLAQCDSGPWLSNNYCSHYDDVGVDCSGIRLVNGPNYYSGRVEIYHNGRWGTVCDDRFDHRDVMVICRMLGYYQGEQYGRPYGNARFGSGSGTIWLDELGCNGYESDVRDCYHQGWGLHDCSRSEDAGVDCYGTVFILYECTKL
ncbi:NETR-like protein, partial [Mya arenaria]